MIIRYADINDPKALAKIQCDAWKDSYKNIIDSEKLNNKMRYDECEIKFKNHLSRRDENSILFVADNHGQVVGYVILIFKRDNKRDNEDSFVGATLRNMKIGQAMLSAIYVLPSEQGKGIGRELLDYTKSFLQKNGVFEMFANCFVKNTKGMDFHLKTGAEIGEKKQEETFGKLYEEYYLKWKI